MSQLFLFAYGSLVSPASLALTLGRSSVAAPTPSAGVLRGFAREWNVGSDRESHPERVLTLPDGRPFTGTMAVLGLREQAGAECPGVLYPLAEPDLEALTLRERNYLLRDVTGAVVAPRLRPSSAVLTCLPTPRALERLVEARAAGAAVVRLGYLRAVENAFAALGDEDLVAFRRTTAPHRLPVREIAVAILPAQEEPPAAGPATITVRSTPVPPDARACGPPELGFAP